MGSQKQSLAEYIVKLIMLGYKIQFYQDYMPEALGVHVKKENQNVKCLIDYKDLSIDPEFCIIFHLEMIESKFKEMQQT